MNKRQARTIRAGIIAGRAAALVDPPPPGGFRIHDGHPWNGSTDAMLFEKAWRRAFDAAS